MWFRMIQLYEQGKNDIAKANVDYILKLSKAIGVDIELLIRSESEKSIY